MGNDAANIAASAAKSLEVDRSPNVTQRASEISQEQLAGESVSALTRKKTEAAEQIQRDKVRRERERRRREFERLGITPGPNKDPDEDSSSGIDVVV